MDIVLETRNLIKQYGSKIDIKGIKEEVEKYPYQLSGGQKRRLSSLKYYVEENHKIEIPYTIT